MKIPPIYSKHYETGEHRRPPKDPKALQIVWIRDVPPENPTPEEPPGAGELLAFVVLCPIVSFLSFHFVMFLRGLLGF